MLLLCFVTSITVTSQLSPNKNYEIKGKEKKKE